MKSTVEVLREAREFLSDPDRWLRNGDYAVSHGGVAISSLKSGLEDAGKACAIGACRLVDGVRWEDAGKALERVLGREVSDWNDWTATHADLLALFDKTIAAEESK